MFFSSVCCLPLAFCLAALSPGEPNQTLRPISEADSVLAVYREDWGLASSGAPAVLLVAWPDGHIVWSSDRLKGGPPYYTGSTSPKKVAALLARFEKDGLLADEKLNDPQFGPDSQFTTLLIKRGKQQAKMQSWHELFEVSDSMVVDHHGVQSLRGRRRLDVLRKAPKDYLFFRLVWSETRGKLNDLIPAQGTVSAGKPFLKVGVLSWQEPAATPKTSGAGSPPPKGSGPN
jgi:hypothetical protein